MPKKVKTTADKREGTSGVHSFPSSGIVVAEEASTLRTLDSQGKILGVWEQPLDDRATQATLNPTGNSGSVSCTHADYDEARRGIGTRTVSSSLVAGRLTAGSPVTVSEMMLEFDTTGIEPGGAAIFQWTQSFTGDMSDVFGFYLGSMWGARDYGSLSTSSFCPMSDVVQMEHRVSGLNNFSSVTTNATYSINIKDSDALPLINPFGPTRWIVFTIANTVGQGNMVGYTTWSGIELRILEPIYRIGSVRKKDSGYITLGWK